MINVFALVFNQKTELLSNLKYPMQKQAVKADSQNPNVVAVTGVTLLSTLSGK